MGSGIMLWPGVVGDLRDDCEWEDMDWTSPGSFRVPLEVVDVEPDLSLREKRPISVEVGASTKLRCLVLATLSRESTRQF